ncbi:hypothetical protein B566_EDAN013816 [Ephemera danica]|nr:hypothetical protein B566_EDAN013816 [Ephemera danica]
MNGGLTLGRCAVHSPLPPPPKPPRDKKAREARGPLCASWAERIGRQRLIAGGVTLLALTFFLGVGLPFALDLRASRLLEARLQVVQRILKEAPLIDGHNDLAWNIRKRTHNRLRDFRFFQDLRDDVSWSKGGKAYVPCGAQFLDAVQLTLEQIDVITRLVEKYPKQMQLVTSAEELEIAHRTGRIASLIGIEGGHSLGSSLAILRTFYQLGARYVTLTHACNTPWADSSLVDEAVLGLQAGRAAYDEDEPPSLPVSEHDGLSDFGKLVVQEMNRLGMIVDLSHVAVRTVEAAMRVTRAPVIFSHSAAQALCNSSRNVPDHILAKLSLNGGVVMVSFFNQFLSCKKEASMKDVIGKKEHYFPMMMREIMKRVPEGLEDVSKYPMLLAELARDRRWSADDIKKLVGGNLVRVLRDAERVRNEWERAQVGPYEEWISLEDLDGKTQERIELCRGEIAPAWALEVEKKVGRK